MFTFQFIYSYGHVILSYWERSTKTSCIWKYTIPSDAAQQWQKTVIIFLYLIFQCIREKHKFPCGKQLEKVILLGSFWVLGHFNNYFCIFLYSLFDLKNLDCRRLSTIMTASVWINLCQKVPLSFGKVWSMTECLCIPPALFIQGQNGGLMGNQRRISSPAIMVCFNSYVVKSFLSVS